MLILRTTSVPLLFLVVLFLPIEISFDIDTTETQTSLLPIRLLDSPSLVIQRPPMPQLFYDIQYQFGQMWSQFNILFVRTQAWLAKYI